MSKNLPVDRQAGELEDINRHHLKDLEISDEFNQKGSDEANALLQTPQDAMENSTKPSMDAKGSPDTSPVTHDTQNEDSSSSDEQEEGEIEEHDDDDEVLPDEQDDEIVALSKQKARAAHMDHETHPNKRIALTSEAKRQQNAHRGRTRQEKRQISSSSEEEEEDIASDDADEDDDHGLGQRRRHSQSLSARRRVNKEEETWNTEDCLRQLKDATNPKKIVDLVVNTTVIHILTNPESLDANRNFIDSLLREWLPKYAILLLSRGYWLILH